MDCINPDAKHDEESDKLHFSTAVPLYAASESGCLCLASYYYARLSPDGIVHVLAVLFSRGRARLITYGTVQTIFETTMI